jgi:hypothetical protein
VCVCVAGCEVAICLFVSVWVGDMGGFVSERGEEGSVVAGEVGADSGGDGIGEG